MVFDGKKLSPFDSRLLADLKEAQAAPIEPDTGSARPGRPRRDRQIGAVVMATFVLLVAVVGVVAVRSSSGGGDDAQVLPGPDQDRSVAEQQVLDALGQTTAVGTMHIEYRMSETFGSAPPASTCSEVSGDRPVVVIPDTGADPTVTHTPSTAYGPEGPASEQGTIGELRQQLTASGSQVCSSGLVDPVTVTGAGSLTLDPKTMEVSADLSGGLQVSVRLEGDRVWESGGAGYGMVSGPDQGGSGQPLSGFASLVEGTLGPREGALAMTRMASPNAYLGVEQPTVTGATVAGPGSVDAIAVTNYTVEVDLHQLVRSPGLSADENTTIEDALRLLDDEGYHGTTATVSVDAEGLIRRVVSVSSFDDGGTVTHEATYSDFDCAGPCASTSTTVPSTTSTTPTTPSSAPSIDSSTTSSSTETTTPASTTTSVELDRSTTTVTRP